MAAGMVMVTAFNHQVSAAIGIAGCSTLLTGLSELGAVYAYTVIPSVIACSASSWHDHRDSNTPLSPGGVRAIALT
jgi:hypothetical protein